MNPFFLARQGSAASEALRPSTRACLQRRGPTNAGQTQRNATADGAKREAAIKEEGGVRARAHTHTRTRAHQPRFRSGGACWSERRGHDEGFAWTRRQQTARGREREREESTE